MDGNQFFPASAEEALAMLYVSKTQNFAHKTPVDIAKAYVSALKQISNLRIMHELRIEREASEQRV